MQVEQGALVKLAEGWSKPSELDRLRQQSHEAFATLLPQHLDAARTLAGALLGQLDDANARPAAQEAIDSLLDAVRRPRFVSQLTPDLVEGWSALAVALVERADYTLGRLLASRERTDPKVVALRVLSPEPREMTVAELARRTRAIARGLLTLLGDDPRGRVAILAENCLESALVDLACLTNGIFDVPVPANAVGSHIEYILNHCGAGVLVVSNDEQASKVLPILPKLKALRSVVMINRAGAERHGLLSLDQLVEQGSEVDDEPRAARAEAVRSGDLATAMYTSGTTGTPKGISFSQRNIVTKRFCRAFAVPPLGASDAFLAYLPLYHTFGRWLELTGSLFWGATYTFARAPAQEVLLEDFQAVRPTVFISVPKKWMELHEAAVRAAGSEDPDRVAAELRRISGGRLRFGLSAAGYLDPYVFKGVRRAGIELCSGYGMTEATGGVTMTPPGEYVEGSIGKPLPGIECRIAEDGELLLRGSYVMAGYLDPPDGDSGLDPDGWFATGDVVARDEQGHLRITDRKKEIYKNRKGQTIAPQRVENLFRDFEAVAQAFLVGDHRDYNTLLIWPNYEGQPALVERSPEELRELLGSLVASANRFLAPFERVVTFQILPRALDEAHGELTPKGTYKRQAVQHNWAGLIEPMYAQLHLVLATEGLELRVPNWVLREIGVLQQDVRLGAGALHAAGRRLTVAAVPGRNDALRVGDFVYEGFSGSLDLGAVLSRPALWLGNEELRSFVGQEAWRSLFARRPDAQRELRVDLRGAPPPTDARLAELRRELADAEPAPESLHAAAVLLRADPRLAREAIAHLERGLLQGRTQLAAQCRALLRRTAEPCDLDTRRWALRALLPAEEPGETLATIDRFVQACGELFDTEDEVTALCERGLSEAQLEVLLGFANRFGEAVDTPVADPRQRRLLVAVARLLASFAIARPSGYARVRIALARLTVHADPEVAARAGEELDRLQLGFRAWIGPNLRLAVDPETGHEYGWREVVRFDEDVAERRREPLARAIGETSLVRESVFLLGGGALVRLADLAPGAASVNHLGTSHGKSVYRLALQTRAGESFDVAINLADTMPAGELREEVRWLLSAGAPPPLVESFGGYYPEHGIFTEEYIAGETVARQIARLTRLKKMKRLRNLWPFLGWSALSAHAAFWERTGRRFALTEPAPNMFIVPSHDYQVGTRLVSISKRSPCESFRELLQRFHRAFLVPVEQEYPHLKGGLTPHLLLSAFVEALGLARATALLEGARGGEQGEAVAHFLETMRREGYTPRRAFFAVRRFQRWLGLNAGATVEAQAAMLAELWSTYGLDGCEKEWPDTRIRFFAQTVFAQARPQIAAALERLGAAARERPLSAHELSEQVAAIRASVRPTGEEDYFLARMAYRHLTPTDEAELVSLGAGDRNLTDVAVALGDSKGGRFLVRGPVNAREVSKLLHLFHDSNLPVAFGPEHEFLLAIDEKETVIGGVFWRLISRERAHLEKIAVARAHRHRHVSEGVMSELLRRLASRGVRTLETGFFHPEYMQRFGFRTDPQHGGLFRDLRPPGREGSR